MNGAVLCTAGAKAQRHFQSNERLLAESEQAEIEHAKHQPSIDRAKAAFFGSAPAIIRIILHVLPIGALFLPLLSKGGSKMNIIDIYKSFQEQGFGGLIKDALSGSADKLSVLLLLLSATMIVVCLVCLVMSLGKHGKIRNLILNAVMLGSAIACTVLWSIGGNAPSFGI